MNEDAPMCESCGDAPAMTHSTNPDWSGYDLCADCAAEYDQRDPLYPPTEQETTR